MDIDAYLKKPDANKDIMTIIISLFQAISEIHKYFIFNDVRNANILIKDNTTLFVDWDLGIKIDSYENVISSYKLLKSFTNPTILEDLIKTFIGALSIYYQINFELLVSSLGLSRFKDFLISIGINKDIIYCFTQLILAYE